MATRGTDSSFASKGSGGDGGGETNSGRDDNTNTKTNRSGRSIRNDAAAVSSTTTTTTSTPSSLRIQMQLATSRKRKRVTGAATTEHNSNNTILTTLLASSSSSSSSSSDEEDEGNSSNNNLIPPPTNKNGWRVKLYRLNADGSWDDRGTGKIVCQYNNDVIGKQQQHRSAPGGNNNNNKNAHNHNNILKMLGEPVLLLTSEHGDGHTILLRSQVLLREAYQRQGDNIITWVEPYQQEDYSTPQAAAATALRRADKKQPGVELALSFQDNTGCLDIWRQITHVQSRAAEWFRTHPPTVAGQPSSSSSTQTTTSSSNNSGSVTDMAHAVAAAHHASLQRQEQHAMWVNVASEAAAQQQNPLEHGLNCNVSSDGDAGAAQHSSGNNNNKNGSTDSSSDSTANDDDSSKEDSSTEAVAVSMAAAAAAAYGNDSSSPDHQQQSSSLSSSSLPNPPTLQNLEEIADIIAAAQQLQQRESLVLYMSRNDCFYLRALLGLFPSAEARGDYGALATLAACVKTILLMNDPTAIELIVSETDIYEQVCSVLEYDPDLRDKANHRWFLRERAKFRTVVLMEDQELVGTIHKSFRVAYLRDTLLRPTMDENSLSTLTSLQSFTHADVVKGITLGGDDSYLVKVLRTLGRDIPEIARMEWSSLEAKQSNAERGTQLIGETLQSSSPLSESNNNKDSRASPPLLQKVDSNKEPDESASWKQHLAPQDGSLASRLIRRKGALSFFRELFNMVRVSLQQGDKDDFYAAIVNMEVNLERDKEESGSVNLLSLLANVLADPTADTADKGGVLEIVSAIAMHDASHIRQHCWALHEVWKKKVGEGIACPATPKPNAREPKQILFCCFPNDLLASLLFLMAVETDAGLLLQTSEIMRVILDTDMLSEHGPLETRPPGMQHLPMDHPAASHDGPMNSEQNNFLSMFYEHYVQWLVAPFQYEILHPAKRAPDDAFSSTSDSLLMPRMLETLNSGVSAKDPFLKQVRPCTIRSSFAVELLSFCVRAHLHRMKFYLLRSRVLGSVLRILKPIKASPASSGDRCLKLAALRFLRSILSVKDEFYHRHIIQHNLFAPVFEAFRANPVGDNLVSSAIVEMCDFIHNQNIKSLIEYIVTKHLSVSSPSSVTDRPSLEDVATPYVQTLTILRKTYEEDLRHANDQASEHDGNETGNRAGPCYHHHPRIGMSEKAMEDQRKFRQVDEEESYFDCDDGEGTSEMNETPMSISADDTSDSDLHRTPRMFSLSEQVASLESHSKVDSTGGNDYEEETNE